MFSASSCHIFINQADPELFPPPQSRSQNLNPKISDLPGETLEDHQPFILLR